LNNELRRLWKEVICVTFHALSWHYPRRTESTISSRL
jgi:hypothetical protein